MTNSTTSGKPRMLKAQKNSAESKEQKQAHVMLHPTVNCAGVIDSFKGSYFGEIDIQSVVNVLSEDIEQLESGNVSRLEAMLYSQAVALQNMFVSLARRSTAQSDRQRRDAYLGFALKAQSQSRATIQAIVEVKYPRQVAFVKQANIAHGNQQVNFPSSTRPCAPAHAGISQAEQNKLLEANHGKRNERLDPRTPRATTRGNPEVATLGKIYGAKKP